MCLQDLAISRKSRIRRYLKTSGGQPIRVKANPDRIALYLSCGNDNDLFTVSLAGDDGNIFAFLASNYTQYNGTTTNTSVPGAIIANLVTSETGTITGLAAGGYTSSGAILGELDPQAATESGGASGQTQCRVLSFTYQTHPGIVSGELLVSTSGGSIRVIEVELDNDDSAAVQSIGGE